MWSKRCFIIAEAGVNHNGEIDKAYELIDAAYHAKVDAVKFQTFQADSLVTKAAKMAEYQMNNLGYSDSQHQMLKKLELPISVLYELKEYAEHKGLLWFSTAFDIQSIDFLKEMDIGVWKIPSGEITNLPYLQKIAVINKPVILSTGMANLAEIEAALQVFLDAGRKREEICILHCNTEYPTPWQDVNLRAMPVLGSTFGTDYGYSDHTNGVEVPIAAVAMGAKVIEKHFTLDKSLPGPDHKASLEPQELKLMVESIRNIESAMGGTVKKPSPSELKNKPIARKSIVASRNIQKGEVLSEDMITTMRPGDGISPMFWYDVVGTTVSKDYIAGDKIIW
tara:strand:+ start:6406 stop:7416 length:1011 start_codon:yes stop_codon:yes gene_type:complete